MQAAPKRRRRSITARIRAMVMIPTSALVALWLILTGVLGTWAFAQLVYANSSDELVTPAAVGLVDVMEERSATVAHIENPDSDRLAQQLSAARTATDDSLGPVVDELITYIDTAPEEAGTHIELLYTKYQEIDGIRSQVDSGDADREDALAYYNQLVHHGTDSFDGQSRASAADGSTKAGVSAVYTFRAVDALSTADAQLSHAFSTGDLDVEDQREFTRLVGAYENFLNANAQHLSQEQAQRYEALTDTAAWERLKGYERQITDRRVESETVTDPVTLESETVEDLSMPVTGTEWQRAYEPVLAELTAIGADEAIHSTALTRSVANTWLAVAVGGSLGIAAIITVAAVLARRSSNHLTDQLLKLRDDSDDLARNKLPEIMERLHRGERVDTSAALPELERDDDEIGDVAGAFNTAQRAAVNAAVQQSELRHGVNRVFLSIAHRNQTLVHRQLRLLDRMEREQEDPDQLSQLFKLDHLATRSRRNAENLLILGGEAPGRTWHRPMPLIDVLRGAISESGDYTRVKRERVARVNLNGPAVADVIHLVAELVDNATMFSPPHTSVRLSSDDVPNGVTVEIEDRGLGMSENELAEANALLAEPPEFDVMRLNEKMRLGLFVVSHLAHRHGIRVHLRSSPYGGVQAIVLLPHELISGDRTALPSLLPPVQEGEDDVREARRITGRGSGADGADGSDKPVLTSVPSPAPSGDAGASAGAGDTGAGATNGAGTGAGAGGANAGTGDAGDAGDANADDAGAGTGTGPGAPAEGAHAPAGAGNGAAPASPASGNGAGSEAGTAENGTADSGSPGDGSSEPGAHGSDSGTPEAGSPEAGTGEAPGSGGGPAEGAADPRTGGFDVLAEDPAQAGGTASPGNPGPPGSPASDNGAHGPGHANGSAPERPALPTRTPRITSVPDGDQRANGHQEAPSQGRPPLPKRRPQESLAPQLATDPPPTCDEAVRTGRPSGGETDSAERLARLRKNMSAFQQGTDRGRRAGKQQSNESDKDE